MPSVSALPAEVEIPQDVKPLFEPMRVGALELQHRIVYAPLTRCRAINTVPIPEMATYYGQRASPGITKRL
jgi:12-oxophytodienoic acid reductase